VKTRRWNSCVAPLILNFGSGWWWLFSFTTRSLYPRKRIPVPIENGFAWVKEPVWTYWRRGKSLSSARIQTTLSCSIIFIKIIYLLCEWYLHFDTRNTPWYLRNFIPILHLQFVVHVMLFPTFNALHFTSALPAVCVQCPLWPFIL
jgi:hypothetical protein